MTKTKEEANPEFRKQLEKINLEPKVIDNTLANAKVTEALLATIQEAGITECDKKIGKFPFFFISRLLHQFMCLFTFLR